MIEWAIVPALMAGAAFIPKGKQNDRKKIELIFKNVGYGIRDKEGKLKIPRYKSKKPIYEGINFIEAKNQGKCKSCEKEVKIGDEVYWNRGAQTVVHKKCFDPAKAIRLGTVYKFSIIPGLPATNMQQKEKEAKVFTDGLQKPVEIAFKRTLNISVYDEELPNLFPYADVPKDMKGWVVPIGKAVNGMVWHNFDHIPHMTGAGTTRFGKTVLLRMIMTYLIEHHPNDVEFYIIDLKGGLEFGRYECLKQVKEVAAGSIEAHQLLTYLTNEYPDIKKGEVLGLLENEYVEFRKKGISNVTETRIKKRRFIIVDEGAQLTPGQFMHPSEKNRLIECQAKLSRLAAVGGALGYRLIFATQYPTADTMPRQIKQNADAKISFRLPSGYASGVAIDDYGAEQLPSDIKGRALFKTHELKELQVPYLSHEEMWKLLEQYQEKGVNKNERSDTDPTKANSPGKNLIQFGEDAIRDKRSTPKNTSSRKRKKRSEVPGRNEGLSNDQDIRREKRLLPKRKGKGTGRERE
jgi:S-DNA-T family DNA segregation ATPase FtsK/SpoIIIE